MAVSSVQLSYTLNCPVIVQLTQSGEGVRLMAKFRPKAQIIALCLDDTLTRSLCLVRGVICYKVASFYVLDDLIELSVMQGRKKGIVKQGDHIIIIYSKSEESANNIIRVH